MSTFANPVVVIDNLRPNPNSDSLDIWDGPQGPCQVKRGQFQLYDLAIFVPAESLVDVSRPEFAHLAKLADGPNGRFPGMYRIRGIKLRGQLSVGLVLPLPPQFSSMPIGTDMSEVLGTVKWTPPAWVADYPRVLAANLVPLKVRNVPAYDVENAWRFARLAEEDPQERHWLITEKIHGMNFRMCLGDDGKIIVGSRTRWLRPECAGKPGEWWHQCLEESGDVLMTMFRHAEVCGYNPHALTFYGEVFGPTQDLKYSSPTRPLLRFFDVFDGELSQFLSYSAFMALVTVDSKFPTTPVPALPRMPAMTLKEVIALAREHASGRSTLAPEQMREGVVVRPMLEEMVTLTDTAPDGTVRTKTQRLQFKVVSPEYLSRKDSSEVQE